MLGSSASERISWSGRVSGLFSAPFRGEGVAHHLLEIPEGAVGIERDRLYRGQTGHPDSLTLRTIARLTACIWPRYVTTMTNGTAMATTPVKTTVRMKRLYRTL